MCLFTEGKFLSGLLSFSELQTVMKLSKGYFHSIYRKIALLGTGSLLVIASLTAVGTYAVLDTNAHEDGITGQTQKSNNDGCYCHCTTSSSGTTVSLTSSSGTSPLTTAPNTTYNFTITVANSSESDGGCDISSYSGSGLSPGTGLQNNIEPNTTELTHTSPKSFSEGSTSWNFTYSTGSNPGWDTIYATGNAVNGDGEDDNGECDDNWNFAPKFIIHIVTPPIRMALSQTSISMGQIRVGHRVADSLTVTSNGTDAITISSSGMKSGSQYLSYPTTTNRTLYAGSTEIDSVIFTPTSRGTFNDSLIYNTNSDTVPEQRMGLAVSGQAVQAIFSSTNGNSLAFGNLHAGRTAQQTFYFSNSGDDTLFLQTPSISSGVFSIATGLSTLTYPPNTFGNVVIQFAPTAAQSYTGSLSFTASNSVTAPTVSLSGTGILPEIQISNSDDLGSIRVGQSLSGTITFKNIGTDTLHLSNASLTQSSTLFTLGSYDQVVLPDANGTIGVSYTPTAEGTDNATLNFTTDDPSNTTVSVSISGTGILPHMSIAEKNDTVNLGLVKVNSSATVNIGIANNGGANLTITDVTAGPSPFLLDVSQTEVSPGTTSDITIGFSPTIIGVFTGKAVIQGNDPNNPSDTVYLSGTGINSALSIDPGSVDFGQVPILATVLDTITLTDSGKANVNIENVQLQPTAGAFAIVGSTPTVVTAGGSAIIVLSFKPDTDITYSGSITLTTDDANARTRVINLSGVGLKDPFTINPSQVNFGQVPILTTVMDTITLNNSGTSSLTISKAQLTPASGVFAIVGSTPTQVSAGSTAQVIVSFHPDTAGNYSGSLTLTSNDVSVPIRIVTLTGAGIKSTLSVTPTQINFGTIKIGHDSTISVDLHNIGQAGVTISTISVVGTNASAFSFGTFPTPVTIAAENSSSINVSFTPTAAQTYNDTIRLTLGDGSIINIALQGTGENTAGVSQDNSGSAPFSLSLSPNPAGSSLTAHVTISQTDETLLEVFDAIGHPMLSMPLGMLTQGEHDVILPTESLVDGSYFVRISNPGGAAVDAELIIEKK